MNPIWSREPTDGNLPTHLTLSKRFLVFFIYFFSLRQWSKWWMWWESLAQTTSSHNVSLVGRVCSTSTSLCAFPRSSKRGGGNLQVLWTVVLPVDSSNSPTPNCDKDDGLYIRSTYFASSPRTCAWFAQWRSGDWHVTRSMIIYGVWRAGTPHQSCERTSENPPFRSFQTAAHPIILPFHNRQMMPRRGVWPSFSLLWSWAEFSS